MRPSSICALLLPMLQSLGVAAYSKRLQLDSSWTNHQRCNDVGAAKEFRPESVSSLMVTFDVGEGVVSVVVFELGDEHLGGIRRPGTNEKEIFCTNENIQRELCSASQLGEFLISDEATRKAGHPFITRAVNLSSPIAIHYPVYKPGFYCAALYGFSASSFSATLRAIEQQSTLPAFRTGLQAVYQFLGPAWIALSILWIFRAIENGANCCWILALSAVQVAMRWSSLALGETSGISVGVKVAWYALEALQNSSILVHNHYLLSFHDPNESWFVGACLILYLALYTTTAWADMTAIAESRTTAYCNVLLGLFLAIYIASTLVRLLRPKYRLVERKPIRAISNNSHPRAVTVALGLTCVLFFGIALLNAWFVTRSLKPLEFGLAFWKWRYLTMDGPFEFVFLLWALILALHCGHQRRQQSTALATIEMG